MRFFSMISILGGVLLSGCVSHQVRLAQLNQAVDQGHLALVQLCEQRMDSACALVGRTATVKNPLSIMQSVTSDKSSRLVVMAPKKIQPVYFLRRPQGLERLDFDRITRSFSGLAIDHIEATNLKIGESYELVVVGSDGQLWDRRLFRVLDLQAKRAKVLLVSCMDDSLMDVAEKIWPEAVAHKPDVVMMIGDNTYADKKNGQGKTADPEQIWNRYAETRGLLPFFKIAELIPVVATWDDHDYGSNDSDRTFVHKNAASEAFFAFFAQKAETSGFERGPGVASIWRAFGVNFALLDDRSFRSPNKVDAPDQTHFGREQEEWLKARMYEAKSPFVLVSGDQFFGGYHSFESFEGSHPKNFKETLADWRAARVPLLFLSGDRHLTEIMKTPVDALGYPSFEITSSGIHARVFSGAMNRDPNPRLLVGADGVYNYSILEFMRSGSNLLQVNVTAFAPEHKLLYQKNLTVRRP